ncbi:MAG: prepilin-type N-terminal cleavage/methylation domain-containing protein [Gemmatimonadales bacterium]|jgi:type II secretory pathway pseudopilin PulG
MCEKDSRRRRTSESGFTIVELLVYFTIAVIVIAGVYQLLIGQNRLYIKQRELQDVRTSIRAAANLLAYEFRQASARHGDIHFVSSDSFSIRSLQATGIVCGLHASQPRAGLWGLTGELHDTADDSALIYAAAKADQWVSGSIEGSWSASAGGIPNCDWAGDAVAPDTVVQVSGGLGTPPTDSDGEILIEASGRVQQGSTLTYTASHPALTCEEFDGRALLKIDADKWARDEPMNGCKFEISIPDDAVKLKLEIQIESDDYSQLSDDLFGISEWDELDLGPMEGGGNAFENVEVGAPFRAFRRVTYGIYQDQDEGRYWLGRRVGSAGSYERLTGPLRAPQDSGLHLVFYDLAGNTTTNPLDVRMVDIILRGESLGPVPRAGEAPSAQQDTLTIRVSLRG